MRKICKFVVALAALILFVNVSAAEQTSVQGSGSEKAPANAAASAKAPNKWPFFVSVQLEAGHDSNVSGLNSSFTDVESVYRFDLALEGEIAHRWKIFEVAGGGSFWKSAHDESNVRLENHELYLRGDVDIKEIDKDDSRHRITASGQLALWRSRVGGMNFPKSTTATLAAQWAWEVNDNCNLDNVLVFYEWEDFDEGPVSNLALSRTGKHRSIGAEVNFYLYAAGDTPTNCRHPGILRRYLPAGIQTITFGFRHDDVNAVSEYAALWNQFYADVRIPLKKKGKKYKFSLDVSAGVALVDYDNPSIFDPFVAREDKPRYVETAGVWHLKNIDLRAGFRHGTNSSSDIERYAYERNQFFFGLRFENYKDRKSGSGSTGSDGSSSNRRTGQSGSSGAIDPELNP